MYEQVFILPSFFFGEEDQPSANVHANLLFLLRKTGPGITSVPIFLHFIWDAATAWLDKQCIGAHPGSEPVNPGPPQQSART